MKSASRLVKYSYPLNLFSIDFHNSQFRKNRLSTEKSCYSLYNKLLVNKKQNPVENYGLVPTKQKTTIAETQIRHHELKNYRGKKPGRFERFCRAAERLLGALKPLVEIAILLSKAGRD